MRNLSKTISKRIKRTAAIILSLLMIVVVLFSAYIVTVKADHDCEGEECEVCECIEICIGLLERFGAGASAAAALSVASLIPLLAVTHREIIVLRNTPVSYKVRLNN